MEMCDDDSFSQEKEKSSSQKAEEARRQAAFLRRDLHNIQVAEDNDGGITADTSPRQAHILSVEELKAKQQELDDKARNCPTSPKSKAKSPKTKTPKDDKEESGGLDEDSDDGTIKLKSGDGRYTGKLDPKFAKMSCLVSHILKGDMDAGEIELKNVPKAEIVCLVTEYLRHHKGIRPAPIVKPITSHEISKVVPSCCGDANCTWDADFINQDFAKPCLICNNPQGDGKTPVCKKGEGCEGSQMIPMKFSDDFPSEMATFLASKALHPFNRDLAFQLILAANYMDINSLVHLGIAPIACDVKQMSPDQIKKILAKKTDSTDKRPNGHAEDGAKPEVEEKADERGCLAGEATGNGAKPEFRYFEDFEGFRVDFQPEC